MGYWENGQKGKKRGRLFMKKIVVLASGRGTNFQALIDACHSRQIKAHITALVTNNPKAQAINRAQYHNIPVFILDSKKLSKGEYEKQLLSQCRLLSPDLIVLAGYMKIISSSFIQAFTHKIINIHPSLLPAFAGLHAQKQALEYGAKISGCTVHFVDQGVDTGPIILQSPVPIHDHVTLEDLSQRILEKEHETLISATQLFLEDKLVIQNRKVYIKD